ncbi:hypothetical protein [Paraflavitalea speifideaquila]|uniref:hypothetical protein n=1 Tax=Paraflavitalea speifideaquila TaxID=3076558 RepID=UPI0028E2456E|nr:hypothetical protein [Paraflavitalea speifideiaquila]
MDQLDTLGSFVEVEASNKTEDLPVEKLQEQCQYYRKAFEIKDQDLLQYSYSDMLLNSGQ